MAVTQRPSIHAGRPLLAGLDLALSFWLPGGSMAAEGVGDPLFPLDDPAAIEAGRKRFARTCAAYCHGAEGSGGRAPAFKGNTRLTPDYSYQTISEGRRGADIMPPWGKAFTPAQIWELVAYLQVLARQQPE
jgi:mono/diheme cytochrome c family protein